MMATIGSRSSIASWRCSNSETLTIRYGNVWLAIMLASLLLSCELTRASDDQVSPKIPRWMRRRVALEKVHQVEEFRVFYTLSGEDALPDAEDVNQNDIPDRIENIAIQLSVARSVYVDSMKLRHPLESPRYKGKAMIVDVNVGKMPLTPGGKKVNGSAGDAVINYKRPSDPAGGVPALSIDLSNSLSFKNLTPAHELFHLFQNGYTMFKNGWFTEGTARWAEFALRKDVGQPGALPRNRKGLQALFAKRYSASPFWDRFALVSDSQGKLQIPVELRKTTYVGSTQTVIEDDRLHGSRLIRQLLEELDREDDAATTDNKLKPYAWKEVRQHSQDNNIYIWRAVIQVSRRYVGKSPQVRAMVRSLGS